jgi:phospholipase/carboxylesterase
MWVFARNLPRDYWLLAPRAPYAAKPSGYSWLPSTLESGDSASLEDFRGSAKALVALLDAYAARHELPAQQFDVIGFSEGAAVASTLALTYPERIRRLAMLAGFVPDGVEESLRSQPLKSIPVFVAHGTLDELVGIDHARRSVAILEQSGAQVSFCEAEIAHKVSAGCLRALERFLA